MTVEKLSHAAARSSSASAGYRQLGGLLHPASQSPRVGSVEGQRRSPAPIFLMVVAGAMRADPTTGLCERQRRAPPPTSLALNFHIFAMVFLEHENGPVGITQYPLRVIGEGDDLMLRTSVTSPWHYAPLSLVWRRHDVMQHVRRSTLTARTSSEALIARARACAIRPLAEYRPVRRMAQGARRSAQCGLESPPTTPPGRPPRQTPWRPSRREGQEPEEAHETAHSRGSLLEPAANAAVHRGRSIASPQGHR
jgi:hypothetical protein